MSLIHNATFDSGTRVLSLLDKAGNVISSCEVPRKSNELTLTATADNSSVKLTKKGTVDNAYEVNTGSGWQLYTFDTVIPLNAGQSCKWRCFAHPTTQSLSNYVRFVMTGTIEASGNCNSMLSSDFENLTSLSGYDYAFYNLFNGCAGLTKAPELPSTILATSCYHNMFVSCSSLTRAPELPAMTLATECYNSLFFGCSSLTQVPELPATNLAPAPRCYSFMFAECTALTRAPELPATTLGVACYTTMFRKCTSLIQPPELPASTLDRGCYSSMFQDCSALTQAPSLPATTLADYCYNGMFRGCTPLNEVRISATTTATGALGNWLSGVSATGDFYCDPNATIFPTGESGIPSGWRRIPPVDDITKPLTLTATADNSSVKLMNKGTLPNTYEVNTGSGWQSYTFGTTIHLNNGQSCKWRCSARPSKQSITRYVYFVMTGSIEASGNCNSMLNSDFDNITSLTGYDYAFVSLFQGCASLKRAPSLPATTLADSCYYKMFFECTNLVQAPELPALSIPDSYINNRTNVLGCYVSMFEGCQFLEQAPALPATALGKGCYVRMFYGCTSLVKAPELPATTLPDVLNNGGTSLPAFGCYSDMFGECRSLVQAPALPATTLGGACYGWMFYGCTSLVKAPELPATTLSFYCYAGMFKGCTSLNEIRVSATDISADRCTLSWVQNVSSTGDFYCNTDTAWTTCLDGIPTGWTSHDINTLKALTLTATADNSSVKLAKNGTLDNTFEVDKGNGWEDYAIGTVIPLNAGESCRWRCKSHPTTQSDQNYVQFVMTGKIEASGNANSMLSRGFENLTSLSGYDYAFMKLFNGCTSLTQAPSLPATNLETNCYYSMFDGCTSLTQAPSLPATALANNCYVFMFRGCTSLVQAPELPATTLADLCYEYMFTGCSKLNEVRISATTTATSVLNYWLSGVSATGDFYCDPNATIFPTDSGSGIPKGWTRHALADYPVTP